MKTSDFSYDLPNELIASEPLKERSASRLMTLNKSGGIGHHHFYDLPDLLQAGDLLVFNNSKVIPARLYGHKDTGGKVEILIERVLSEHIALAHVKASKSPKPGTIISLDKDHKITVSGRDDSLFELTLDSSSPQWYQLLEDIGHIPLPPYMEREDRDDDKERYQTVYAKHEGSVAAPTAGLHFDEQLFQKLKEKGIQTAYVTLHVGAGTFQPVRVDNTQDHKMHSERFEITKETCDLIRKTKEAGGRIIAVGTTSVRVLESAGKNGTIEPSSGETDIFITPGYNYSIINGLITNFHLPESTLLMLVSALSGKENILNAYKEAIENKYRFFSYGDAMLLIQ